MSVLHVHTDTAADIASAVASQSVTKPTGFTSGEIGVMVVVNENGSGLTQTSSVAAMTQFGTTQTISNGSERVQLMGFWCNGSVGTITIANTLTGATHQQGYVFSCFSGVDLVTPIDYTPVASNSTASSTLSMTGGTTVTDQCWDCFVAGEWLGTSALTATGFTISENAHSNAAAVVGYNTTPKSIGAVGTVTVNGTAGGSEIIVAIRFALRPAGAAASFPYRQNNAGLDQAVLAMRADPRLFAPPPPYASRRTRRAYRQAVEAHQQQQRRSSSRLTRCF